MSQFSDEHPKETEELWATLCGCWPNNLKVIIRYLIIISGMAPQELLPYVSETLKIILLAANDRGVISESYLSDEINKCYLSGKTRGIVSGAGSSGSSRRWNDDGIRNGRDSKLLDRTDGNAALLSAHQHAKSLVP